MCIHVCTCTCIYSSVPHTDYDSFIRISSWLIYVYAYIRDSGIHSSWLMYMSMFVTHLYVHVCMHVCTTKFVTHLYVYTYEIRKKNKNQLYTVLESRIRVYHTYIVTNFDDIRRSRTVCDSFRCIWPWLIYVYKYVWICTSQSSWLIYI